MQQQRIDSGVNKAIDILKKLWFSFDQDMSGDLDLSECLRLLIAVKDALGDLPIVWDDDSSTSLQECFDMFLVNFDIDKNGRISMQELG